MKRTASENATAPLGQRAFRFFDRLVVVTSDSAEVLEALDAVYDRQRVLLSDAGVADIAVRVLAAGTAPRASLEPVRAAGASPELPTDAAPCGPRIEVGGRTVRVPSPDQLVHYAHLVLANVAAAQVRDAVVLHAAAVARRGRALLLVGPSGQGKTTLTTELVRRGWGFMADDFAALTAGGIVRPLPRRVNLTAETVRLLGLTLPTETLRLATFAGVRKWMVDMEDLSPGCLTGPTPLGWVALLGTPPTSVGETPPDQPVRWRLQLDHLPAGFGAALAALPGVTEVEMVTDEEAIIAEVVAQAGSRIVRALDDACARFDVTVLGAHRLAGGTRPEHTVTRWRAGDPLLTPLTAEQALPELLANALSVSGARFLGRPGELELLRAISLLRHALSPEVLNFHLQASSPDRTADALEAYL